MRTSTHQLHISSGVSHNSCPECRADNQRSFVSSKPFRYAYVNEYLTYAKPRIEAIRTGLAGGNTINAYHWNKTFIKALHTRISSHIIRQGRKHSHGYLERLKMTNVKCGPENKRPNADYLKRFSNRGASCL